MKSMIWVAILAGVLAGCDDRSKTASTAPAKSSAQIAADLAFIDALHNFDAAAVRAALQNEPDLWAVDSRTAQPSILLVINAVEITNDPFGNEQKKKNGEFFVQLAEKIAAKNIDAKDYFGKTALFEARSRWAVDFLVDHHADVNAKDETGRTAVFWNLEADDSSQRVLERLISRGADVNTSDNDGKTPLHIAVEKGYLLTVRNLLKLRADVNAKDAKGYTPLKRANIGMQNEIAKILKEAGCVE